MSVILKAYAMVMKPRPSLLLSVHVKRYNR